MRKVQAIARAEPPYSEWQIFVGNPLSAEKKSLENPLESFVK